MVRPGRWVGEADVESRIAGLERGADAYLTKPFNQKELCIRIENLLAFSKVLQDRYRSLDPLPPTKNPDVQQEDRFITRLSLIVAAHLTDEHFGVSGLCKAVGMSRTQLHLKIKALTGHSTSHFIRMVRLQKAKELLKHSDFNITEIAFEVGFQSPAYFSRSFAEEFGLSPSEFRN